MLNRLLCAALLTLCATAAAQDDPFGLADAASVDDAVAEITARLERQNYDIIAVIDHAANAAGVGLALRPTQVILFSDRRTDRRLPRRSPTLAIDLPLKILVWEDATGALRLSYNDVGYLTDRHDIRPRDPDLRRIDAVLAQFGSLDSGLITVASGRSVADTVAALELAILDAGFIVPLILDYGSRDRPRQLIIFGNPNVGTQLMQNNQAVGIDLPQKFLVWEDALGQTQITYNDPQFLASRHDLQGLDTLLGNIANALNNFAQQGAGG